MNYIPLKFGSALNRMVAGQSDEERMILHNKKAEYANQLRQQMEQDKEKKERSKIDNILYDMHMEEKITGERMDFPVHLLNKSNDPNSRAGHHKYYPTPSPQPQQPSQIIRPAIVEPYVPRQPAYDDRPSLISNQIQPYHQPISPVGNQLTNYNAVSNTLYNSEFNREVNYQLINQVNSLKRDMVNQSNKLVFLENRQSNFMNEIQNEINNMRKEREFLRKQILKRNSGEDNIDSPVDGTQSYSKKRHQVHYDRTKHNNNPGSQSNINPLLQPNINNNEGIFVTQNENLGDISHQSSLYDTNIKPSSSIYINNNKNTDFGTVSFHNSVDNIHANPISLNTLIPIDSYEIVHTSQEIQNDEGESGEEYNGQTKQTGKRPEINFGEDCDLIEKMLTDFANS